MPWQSGKGREGKGREGKGQEKTGEERARRGRERQHRLAFNVEMLEVHVQVLPHTTRQTVR